ncbi:MAG: ATP-binding protein [Sandaracinaceae bacterium]
MSRSRPRVSIPTRILLSFVLVLTGFGVVSAVSLLQHQRTASRLRLLHEGYLPLALILGQEKATQEVVNALLDRVMDETDPTATSDWIAVHLRVRPSSLRRALRALERAEGLSPDSDDEVALAEVRRSLEELQGLYATGEGRFAAVFAALGQGREAEAQVLLEAVRRDEQGIARRLRRSWDAVQDRVAETSQRAAEQERQSVGSLTVLALLSLASGLGLTWWSQRLLAPLPLLMRRVAAVARGDFASRITATRDDELGHLAREFEGMVDAVAARDRALREAADSLRALQRMQEQIVAGLRSGVVVVDGAGSVRSANPAAEHVLGVTPRDVGRAAAEVGLLDRVEGLEAAIREVAEGGERAERSAVPRGPDSDERFLDLSVTPFGADEAAGPRRSVLVVADEVTEELRTKARLIQTERLAAIGRMAAHVTHEVRNPLSSLGLNVELLEEELIGAGPEAQALLRAVQGEIDRLTSLTEEYLRVARLPAPRLEPESLGALVQEVGSFVAREMESSGVGLRMVVEPDLPLVLVDESQVRQALLNLLRNAREAMPNGGEVTLSSVRAGSGVEVAVTDQGAGLPADVRARIFELFYSTKERGTGLGLTLTQQIVAAHGGRVTCEDAPGGGTRFALWFPPAHLAEGASAASDEP